MQCFLYRLLRPTRKLILKMKVWTIIAFREQLRARANVFNICSNILSILFNNVDCWGGQKVSTRHSTAHERPCIQPEKIKAITNFHFMSIPQFKWVTAVTSHTRPLTTFLSCFETKFGWTSITCFHYEFDCRQVMNRTIVMETFDWRLLKSRWGALLTGNHCNTCLDCQVLVLMPPNL